MGFLIGLGILIAVGFGHFDVEFWKIAFILVAPIAFISTGHPVMVFFGIDLLVLFVGILLPDKYDKLGGYIILTTFAILVLGAPLGLLYFIYH